MLTIKVEQRSFRGKTISRRLRTANKFPAIIYGGIEAPVKIKLDHDMVWNLHNKVEFYSEVILIIIDDKKEEQVRVQAIQRHAFKPKLTHIDFIRVKME